jgi:hypothetical protein
MPLRRWHLFVALVFVAGLAAGISLDRYAFRAPASIPAAKPSVREQIIGKWDGVEEGVKFTWEFAADGTATVSGPEIESKTVEVRWADNEHLILYLSEKSQPRLRLVLRDDTLTVFGPEHKVHRLKRSPNPDSRAD